MSNKLTRSLRTHLETAASACKVVYGEFVRARGIKDFFMDADEGVDGPHDLVARALETLTYGDKGRMDFAVCVAAVGFLNEQYGAPNNGDNKQHLKDIALLVSKSGTCAQYKLWAQAWYGIE